MSSLENTLFPTPRPCMSFLISAFFYIYYKFKFHLQTPCKLSLGVWSCCPWFRLWKCQVRILWLAPHQPKSRVESAGWAKLLSKRWENDYLGLSLWYARDRRWSAAVAGKDLRLRVFHAIRGWKWSVRSPPKRRKTSNSTGMLYSVKLLCRIW